MPSWTKEQQQAINCEGKNIIVSAGAGSGKTAVLTERVIRKLKSGVHINELLVLTFTNAAAAEMKERIRKAIRKTKGLEEEMNRIDGAYITTFDSFALSIVKKYHTTINCTNKIQITDDVVIDIEKENILEKILDEKYLLQDKRFTKLIHDFCYKDDKELKKGLLDIYKKIELKYDKSEFLNKYLTNYTKSWDKVINDYLVSINKKRSQLKDLLYQMNSYFDGKYMTKVEQYLYNFLNQENYDEQKKALDSLGRFPALPKNSPEEGKIIKKALTTLLDEIKTEMTYESIEQIEKELQETVPNQEEIIDILKELDKRLTKYKEEKEIYNFTDISRLAIRIVKENKDIQEEVTNSFHEIMVDEYQDTSDTQETFISLISKNNVYMVGDIKQSIYRFRNANPYLFKQKYDTYRDTDQGIKIDLVKNFRSRKEVLEDINLLFNQFMDDEIGGADYKDSHQMVFGNMMYEQQGKTTQNYHMELLTYTLDKTTPITRDEQEAFIIGQDIKEKINSKYKVFDKDTEILRPIEYKDFVILLDKSKNFELYKKIFEYLQIPLSILKEESLSKDNDVLVLKNLLNLIIRIHKKDDYDSLKYSFVATARSYLFEVSDLEIYEALTKDKIKETKLYQLCEELSQSINDTSASEFFLQVIKKVEYEKKLIKIGKITSFQVRLEYIYNLISNLEENGYTIEDVINHLDSIFESGQDLKFNINEDSSNSCKIMTIHKSKGLEFPICYFAGFNSKFNMRDLKEKILFDNTYGIILPVVTDFYKDTILKTLVKEKTKQEEISEKIRLFYVALTRAKEKMIMVTEEIEEEVENRGLVSSTIRSKYNSFLSIIKSIYTSVLPYERKIEITPSKDYLLTKNATNKEELTLATDNLKVQELKIAKTKVEYKKYSKDILHLSTKEEKEKMEFGTKIHQVLEQLDFKNPKLDNYDNRIKQKINNFLNSSMILENITGKFYPEYEFLDSKEATHGIIDLVIEKEDKMIIIDYKLKNIDDDNYDKQLNGYREFLKKKTNKKVECFLYSIIDEKYRKIKEQ
ncbi:MAG TPA: UvrD-helicase domain-containing protein [Candidatus Faecimonas gallistercoris]|nr:UvrD-helicase domain-containing protein [Candidatus Faecimonas gallistercoris]